MSALELSTEETNLILRLRTLRNRRVTVDTETWTLEAHSGKVESLRPMYQPASMRKIDPPNGITETMDLRSLDLPEE